MMSLRLESVKIDNAAIVKMNMDNIEPCHSRFLLSVIFLI